MVFLATTFWGLFSLEVSVTAGLLLSSCCAVVSAVLTADMSEKDGALRHPYDRLQPPGKVR